MGRREELSTGSQDPPTYQRKRLWEAGEDPREKKRRIEEEHRMKEEKRKAEDEQERIQKRAKKEDEEMIGAVEELRASGKSRVQRRICES